MSPQQTVVSDKKIFDSRLGIGICHARAQFLADDIIESVQGENLFGLFRLVFQIRPQFLFCQFIESRDLGDEAKGNKRLKPFGVNDRLTGEIISVDTKSLGTSCLARSVPSLTYWSYDRRKTRMDDTSVEVRRGCSTTLPINFDPVLLVFDDKMVPSVPDMVARSKMPKNYGGAVGYDDGDTVKETVRSSDHCGV